MPKNSSKIEYFPEESEYFPTPQTSTDEFGILQQPIQPTPHNLLEAIEPLVLLRVWQIWRACWQVWQALDGQLTQVRDGMTEVEFEAGASCVSANSKQIK